MLILLLVGCSLNSTQEASLNRAVTAYMESNNAGALVSFVSFTHPNAVKYYKEQGDTVFQNRFRLFTDDGDGEYLQDPVIKTIETDGNIIHVHYSILRVEDYFFSQRATETDLVAVSEDDGANWFFIEGRDYKNEKIISKDNRLIEF